MISKSSVLGAFAVAVLGVAGHSGAAITVQQFYPLGEGGSVGTNNHPQDASGNGRNFGIDFQGTQVTISSDPSPALGSTASYSFDGNEFFYGVGYAAPIDNVGIEAYVKLPSGLTGNQTILESGNGGGLKLQVFNGALWASYDGVTFVGSAFSATPNTWYDVALVRASGTGTFYVNGAASGSTSTATPNQPTGGQIDTLLATDPGGVNRFVGELDNVRTFTFTAGAFSSATDLLSAVPEPSAFLVIGLISVALLPRRWHGGEVNA